MFRKSSSEIQYCSVVTVCCCGVGESVLWIYYRSTKWMYYRNWILNSKTACRYFTGENKFEINLQTLTQLTVSSTSSCKTLLYFYLMIQFQKLCYNLTGGSSFKCKNVHKH